MCKTHNQVNLMHKNQVFRLCILHNGVFAPENNVPCYAVYIRFINKYLLDKISNL